MRNIQSRYFYFFLGSALPNVLPKRSTSRTHDNVRGGVMSHQADSAVPIDAPSDLDIFFWSLTFDNVNYNVANLLNVNYISLRAVKLQNPIVGWLTAAFRIECCFVEYYVLIVNYFQNLCLKLLDVGVFVIHRSEER